MPRKMVTVSTGCGPFCPKVYDKFFCLMDFQGQVVV